MFTCTKQQQALQACFTLPPQSVSEPTTHALAWITSNGHSTWATANASNTGWSRGLLPKNFPKACSGTDMNLLSDSIWLSTGARSNTGATWRHHPASAGRAPELTRSIDRHHNGTGKCACRGFGKRHEAGSNPESRFCTMLACNTDCIAGHPTSKNWMHDLEHKRISLCQHAP